MMADIRCRMSDIGIYKASYPESSEGWNADFYD